MREALARVRRDLGGEALILGSREVRRRAWLSGRFRELVEVTATVDGPESPAATTPRRDVPPTRPTLRDQLDEPLGRLHEAVEELSRHGRVDQYLPELPGPLVPVYSHLLERDVPEPLARRIARLVADLVEPDELGVPAAIRDATVRAVELALTIAPPIAAVRGERRVAALVGATGVGKTTTLAKLAAAAKLDGGVRVGLLTLDIRRVAAAEQLRTYADIIDLPLATAAAPGGVTAALEQLADVELVMVDTPGCNPRDRGSIRALATLLQEARPDETHLLLPAGAGEASHRAALEGLAPLGADRLILSKFDEAERPGGVLSAPGPAGLPVSYVTTGQSVPDDFEAARRTRLARLILGLDRAGG